ncbi:MAG: DUF1836 domain-containing protein [Clostridia bacterium]|jgi:hypothetical protein|nr:uncharacterized protein BN716_00348 [Clostridium sp. CAG:571]
MQNIEPTLLNDIHMPRWNELPNVDLYLDQVVTFINSSLNSFILSNVSNSSKTENQVLTKTMINNYVKNKLIEPPKKKKYSKVQLAKLFVICILKQVYSMNDIKDLINIALQHSDIKIAYNSFCDQFEEALLCTYKRKDYIDNYSKDDTNKYLLKSVLLSCCYTIYTQNFLLQL